MTRHRRSPSPYVQILLGYWRRSPAQLFVAGFMAWVFLSTFERLTDTSWFPMIAYQYFAASLVSDFLREALPNRMIRLTPSGKRDHLCVAVLLALVLNAGIPALVLYRTGFDDPYFASFGGILLVGVLVHWTWRLVPVAASILFIVPAFAVFFLDQIATWWTSIPPILLSFIFYSAITGLVIHLAYLWRNFGEESFGFSLPPVYGQPWDFLDPKKQKRPGLPIKFDIEWSPFIARRAPRRWTKGARPGLVARVMRLQGSEAFRGVSLLVGAGMGLIAALLHHRFGLSSTPLVVGLFFLACLPGSSQVVVGRADYWAVESLRPWTRSAFIQAIAGRFAFAVLECCVGFFLVYLPLVGLPRNDMLVTLSLGTTIAVLFFGVVLAAFPFLAKRHNRGLLMAGVILPVVFGSYSAVFVSWINLPTPGYETLVVLSAIAVGLTTLGYRRMLTMDLDY